MQFADKKLNLIVKYQQIKYFIIKEGETIKVKLERIYKFNLGYITKMEGNINLLYRT